MITQMTGLLGQVGQIMSAIPFAALLAVQPWTFSFLMAAAVTGLSTVIVIAFLKQPPRPTGSGTSPGWTEIREILVIAWRHPGTRLGLWVHFTSQFTNTVFALLWGFPFLTAGLGMSQEEASGLITFSVLVGLGFSPLLGALVARHPLRRSSLVFAIVGIGVIAWTIVIAWPGRAPFWSIVLLMIAVSVGGPGSMVGFDFARTFNPPHGLGSATGIVNVGGFVASLITMWLMGIIIDIATPAGQTYTLGAFKWGFSVQYLMGAFGIVMILRLRRLTRRRLHSDDGVVVPPLRQAVKRDWQRYRNRNDSAGPQS